MINKLNKQQDEAVRKDAPQYAVVAPAGAGKTTVLVERYLHHVVDKGFTPDQVLAITFTRKAAAEMKHRIVERLRALGRTADAQMAETGPISTIHAFCERILRENALAARVDPQFDLLVSPQDQILMEQAVTEALSYASDDPLVDKLIVRLAGKSAYRVGPLLDGVLRSTLSAILEQFRSSGHGYDTIQNIYRSPEHLLNYSLQTFAKTNPALQNILQTESGYHVLQILKKLKPAERGDAVDWLNFSLDPSVESASYEESWALATLALDVWDRLERLLRQNNAMDFALLESRAVDLLVNNADVLLRVRNQYRAMLVDETQDVNPVQFLLLDKLGFDHTMMVGDPQQSIYGFRGAEPKEFNKKTHGPETVFLKENYRSSPQIIAFVNDVFGRMWGEDYRGMSPDPAKPKSNDDLDKFEGVEIWDCPAFDSNLVADQIHQMVSNGTKAGDIAVLTQVAANSASIAQALDERGIAALISGGSDRFYVRMETRDLANALTACADPKDTFALAALLLSPFVGLSLDAVALAAVSPSLLDYLVETELPDPDDDAKRTRFLAWFPDLQKIADRVPAWELVSELLYATDYFQNVLRRPNGQQTFANMRKLLTIASAEPFLKAEEYADFIRQLPDLRHRESDASIETDPDSTVKIMTIFSAKGLEFPVVVLPDLYRGIRHFGSTYIDRESSLVALAAPKGKWSLKEWIGNRSSTRELEERRRLLYVAMTRAKEKLCLCLPSVPGRTTSLAKILVETLGYPDRLHPGILVRTAPQTKTVDSPEP